MTPASTSDPACPGAPERPAAPRPIPNRRLRLARRPVAEIDRAAWDRLAAANPWATPFSRWAFQRAWWEAYGVDAEGTHDETLVAFDPDADPAAGGSPEHPLAIVPLMHRHVREPGDDADRTTLRGPGEPDLTPTPATDKAIFFGASYHADYATVLAAPEHLADVAEALAAALEDGDAPGTNPEHPQPWDVVDLRRLRCGDPAADALAAAFGRREIPRGWTLNLEREDVCPVATLPEDGDLETFLAGLDKKERHEIRRKVRRAEAAGEVRLDVSADPLADLDAFIDLHQARWGADGLFPPTPGGDRSRVQFRRMFELFAEAAAAPGGSPNPLRLAFLSVGGRRVGASVTFETADTVMYYNAGVDPEARELSPGVVLVERLVRAALDAGKRRFDFLRGDEPYKYGWGAVDEPIQRLLVRRTVST